MLGAHGVVNVRIFSEACPCISNRYGMLFLSLYIYTSSKDGVWIIFFPFLFANICIGVCVKIASLWLF